MFEEAEAPDASRLSNGGQWVGGVVSEDCVQCPGHDLGVGRKMTGRRVGEGGS